MIGKTFFALCVIVPFHEARTDCEYFKNISHCASSDNIDYYDITKMVGIHNEYRLKVAKNDATKTISVVYNNTLEALAEKIAKKRPYFFIQDNKPKLDKLIGNYGMIGVMTTSKKRSFPENWISSIRNGRVKGSQNVFLRILSYLNIFGGKLCTIDGSNNDNDNGEIYKADEIGCYRIKWECEFKHIPRRKSKKTEVYSMICIYNRYSTKPQDEEIKGSNSEKGGRSEQPTSDLENPFLTPEEMP